MGGSVEAILVLFDRGFVRQSATDMVHGYGSVTRSQRPNEIPVVKGPGRVTMNHDKGCAGTFIHVVILKPVDIHESGRKGV